MIEFLTLFTIIYFSLIIAGLIGWFTMGEFFPGGDKYPISRQLIMFIFWPIYCIGWVINSIRLKIKELIDRIKEEIETDTWWDKKD